MFGYIISDLSFLKKQQSDYYFRLSNTVILMFCSKPLKLFIIHLWGIAQPSSSVQKIYHGNWKMGRGMSTVGNVLCGGEIRKHFNYLSEVVILINGTVLVFNTLSFDLNSLLVCL
jgi:hypothetical protein